MLLIRSSRATINLLEPYFTETDSLVSAANWADLHTSLRNNLSELGHDTLLSQTATKRGLFHRKYVQRFLDEHTGFAFDGHPRLWCS